jgi:hypothetical protein
MRCHRIVDEQTDVTGCYSSDAGNFVIGNDPVFISRVRRRCLHCCEGISVRAGYWNVCEHT